MPLNLKYVVDEDPPSAAQQVEDFYEKMLSDVSFYNTVVEQYLNKGDAKNLETPTKNSKTPIVSVYPGPECPCIDCRDKYRTGTTSTKGEKIKVSMVE